MIIRVLAVVAAAVLTGPSASAQDSTAIHKCKDENGKWHYGDQAAEACAKSRVTVIDERGLTVDEMERPMTDEEYEAQQEADELRKARERAEAEQRRKDIRLLTTFDDEQSIDHARARRLRAIDATLKVNAEFLDKLQYRLGDLQRLLREDNPTEKDRIAAKEEIEAVKQSIDAYERSTAERLVERRAVEAEYNDLLERYRRAVKRQVERRTRSNS